MAHPGVPAPSPVQPERRATPGHVINFRCDKDLSVAVADFAKELKVSRSEACRLLLTRGLGQPLIRAEIREAHFQFSELRKVAVGRLAMKMQELIPALLQEVFTDFGVDPEEAAAPSGDTQ